MKIPPHNIDAEKSLIASVLIDSPSIYKIMDSVTAEDFYDLKHQTIYENIISLIEKRQPIDIVTLTDSLEKNKKLADAGGAGYLAELTAYVNSSAHIVSYSAIVKNNSTLRQLISAGSEIVELGFDESSESDEILEQAERLLFNVSQKFMRSNFVAIKDILSETFERIDELHKEKGKVRGVRTGFRALDNLLAGLQNSDLVIVAGRPSMGKSSLAMNMAVNAAKSEKKPVAIFSLEMSKDQLVDRLLVGLAGIDSWKLRTGNLSDDDFPRIGEAMGELSEAPIYIDDSPMLNIVEMRAKLRRLQNEHGLCLVILDYLQLMEGRRKTGDPNRVQEISEISRSLKGIARELNVPVVALSQLSRAVEQRHPKIPQLSDLRDSGTIEQDSDVVMFIYREDYYEPDTERKNIADILIKKHRNGPIGQVELFFIPEQMKFVDLEKRRGE
ncbi:MAG: Replicative DNA helicase [Candidatus Berkelbacteria bacterium Licking1014_85]|uniref:Replicative DNA helicase n=1 Tax=Candidatus Berkelbacteria bacterium Licking1014_85 TaxID=2017148 RepID=A0A554LL58_9BACT|nr:MAG: Replicative DNA helicase [Candidatus Berkelbacteria bacterium Licking1014_85]